jgi:hypothetical protein
MGPEQLLSPGEPPVRSRARVAASAAALGWSSAAVKLAGPATASTAIGRRGPPPPITRSLPAARAPGAALTTERIVRPRPRPRQPCSVSSRTFPPASSSAQRRSPGWACRPRPHCRRPRERLAGLEPLRATQFDPGDGLRQDGVEPGRRAAEVSVENTLPRTNPLQGEDVVDRAVRVTQSHWNLHRHASRDRQRHAATVARSRSGSVSLTTKR